MLFKVTSTSSTATDWQGHLPAVPFTNSVTGQGETPYEALQDAFEQMIEQNYFLTGSIEDGSEQDTFLQFQHDVTAVLTAERFANSPELLETGVIDGHCGNKADGWYFYVSIDTAESDVCPDCGSNAALVYQGPWEASCLTCTMSSYEHGHHHVGHDVDEDGPVALCPLCMKGRN